jgi:hypothetical protein
MGLSKHRKCGVAGRNRGMMRRIVHELNAEADRRRKWKARMAELFDSVRELFDAE